MTDHVFHTDRPIRLFVEIGKGSVKIDAVDTGQTLVRIDGKDADRVVVTHDRDEVSVVSPRAVTGFMGSEPELDVTVTVPRESDVVVRTGSADISLHGPLHAVQAQSGSGDILVESMSAPALLKTGSGDISVDTAAAELRVKSGSGDVRIGQAHAATSISTGSGDVAIDSSAGPTAVKTGSGDLAVGDSAGDLSMTTGSGDLAVAAARRGQLLANGASGDIHVGVPAGTPVWTDIHTITGAISSDLVGAGQPAEGQDHLEVRAKTATGEIVLRQI